MVAKWLKKVFCATSARSQISEIRGRRDAVLVEERLGRGEQPRAHLELAPLAARGGFALAERRGSGSPGLRMRAAYT